MEISTSTNICAFQRGRARLPVEFSTKAYETIIRDGKVLQGLKYSVIYTGLGTLVNILLTVITAYPMSRKEMPFRNAISIFFAFTMFFGGGMIPTFLLVQKLGLYDSIWAMIIPGAMQIYNMIIMRTYFQSIPGELMEAARIDGTNEWQTLWQIVLPLSKASIATIGLQLVLRNMIFNAQALVRSGEADNIGTTTINYATLFISMVPMMIIYPFVQKYFVKGVMVGSVKG